MKRLKGTGLTSLALLNRLMDYEAAPDRLTWESPTVNGAEWHSIYPRDLILHRPVWAVLSLLHPRLRTHIIYKRCDLVYLITCTKDLRTVLSLKTNVKRGSQNSQSH